MAHTDTADTTRRDFLHIATASAGGVGVALAAWPLIAQMNPAANVLALATIEVDLAAVQPGQLITVMWRGRPTFIRRLTPQEIATANAVPVDDLIDETARNGNLAEDAQASVENRVVGPAGAAGEWLVAVGVCTHLGCIPEFGGGEYGGWLCACHGSQYDSLARVRVGPAPQNLPVPPVTFLSDTRIQIG